MEETLTHAVVPLVFQLSMEETLTHAVVRLVFQLALILLAAKIGGEICIRYLRVPPVLGELVVGIIIGPFALGAVVLGGLGPLFPIPSSDHGGGAIPLSPELYSIATVASIILLFAAGIETNLRQFLKYAGPASLVALGGLVVPFVLGVVATTAFGFAATWTSPEALFMGAIMTATSVGITARVLTDLHRLESPEGVTVIAAAVVDDVIGIMVLTIIVGMNAAGGVSLANVAFIGGKALAFWFGLMAVGILLSNVISRIVGSFKVEGAKIALAIAIALFAAGLAESFGLAMIIGAYSVGLALSNTRLARELETQISSVYNALVPIFFVSMGMLVDVSVMGAGLMFGLVLTSLAIVGKVVGSGVPGLLTGFNLMGATRVGVGMMPRGEVALIVAGVGLSQGVIGQNLFGVSILMTLATTLLAPILLVPLFKDKRTGRRHDEAGAGHASDGN